MARTSDTSEFDATVEEAWREFRSRLAERLGRLTAGEPLAIRAYPPGPGLVGPPVLEVRHVRNRLIASVPQRRGPSLGRRRWAACRAYLEDSWWDPPDDTARAKWRRRSWWLKVSPQYVDFLAVEVVRLLRDGFGVVHPSLLAVPHDVWDTTAPRPLSAWEEDADEDVDLPPLSEVELRSAHHITDHEHLLSLVVAAVAAHIGGVPTLDEDGDIPVGRQHTMTFVRVHCRRPVVELCCWPVTDIRDLAAAEREVAILNRDHPALNAVLADELVLVRASLIAQPFVPQHLQDALEGFTALMDAITLDLAARVGGRRWFDPTGDYAPREESA